MQPKHRRVLLAFGLSCLTGLPTWAQIQDLATTDDGAQLYFSSVLRLKGSSEYTNGKIFQYTSGAFTLTAQTAPTATLVDGTVFQFDFRMPSVSGDGSILTYDGTASCKGSSCPGSFTARGFVTGAQLPPVMTAVGSLRVSHNGRYTIVFGGTQAGISPSGPYLYDSQQAQLSIVNGCGQNQQCSVIGDGRQSVADDGTVLTTQGLWRNGQLTPIPVPQNPLSARLSPNGTTIVFESANISGFSGDFAFGFYSYKNQLSAYNVATGESVLLEPEGPFQTSRYPFAGQPYFFPSLSADGSTVLYTSATQAVIRNTDGTNRRTLTNDPGGIVETVISGDGLHAYAATTAGDLLSIDTGSGSVQHLLPDAPLITQFSGPVVPGSLLTLSGQDLGTVSIGGLAPPLLLSSPTSLTVQVPWEIGLKDPVAVITAATESPFEQATIEQPVAAAPQFLGFLQRGLRGPAPDGVPARPGEILAAFLTGLGPVSPPAATGQPASLSVPSYVQFPFSCFWQDFTASQGVQNLSATVVFAGLAPGLVGAYQANVEVPTNIAVSRSGPEASLICTSTLPSGETASSVSYVPIGAANPSPGVPPHARIK